MGWLNIESEGTHKPEPEKERGKTGTRGDEDVTHWTTVLVLCSGTAQEIKY